MKAAILLLVLFAAVCYADIWSNCGQASDHLQIDTVTITPDPPVAGQNITVSASGYLDEIVTNGTVNVVLKYDNFITVVKQTISICESGAVTCPIAAGQYSQTITELIPSSVPRGQYNGTVTIADQTGSEIACISLGFEL